MSYSGKKSAGRSTSTISTPVLAPAASTDEKATGSGKRKLAAPTSTTTRSLGNQLRIRIVGELKTALNNYDSITLAAVSDPSEENPPYSRKSPSRTVTPMLSKCSRRGNAYFRDVPKTSRSCAIVAPAPLF